MKITSPQLQELSRQSHICFDGGNHLYWQNLAEKLNAFLSDDESEANPESTQETSKQPCGHDERYEMEWREVSKGGHVTHVWFCIACNYDSVTKHIAKEDNVAPEPFVPLGM